MSSTLYTIIFQCFENKHHVDNLLNKQYRYNVLIKEKKKVKIYNIYL